MCLASALGLVSCVSLTKHSSATGPKHPLPIKSRPAGPSHGTVSATLLEDASGALRTKLSLIRSARSEILLTVFLWRGDETGGEVAAALQEAARRGVRVRLLVDYLRMGFPAAMVDALCATPGVEMRLFHPPSMTRPMSINLRLHDKLLIVDRHELVIGGRNFTDFYYDRGRAWNYVDLDLRIDGQAAHAAADYFERVWASASSVPWRSPPNPSVTGTARDAARQLQQGTWNVRRGQKFLDAAKNAPAGPPRAVTGSKTLHVPSNAVRFVSEDLPRGAGVSECLTAIEEMLAEAQHEVWVSSPWLVDTPRMHAAFADCVKRGVKLHVLTNGIEACQDFSVFPSHEEACREWAHAGAQVRWLPGPESLHTKAVVVDGRLGAVGTFNFDPRSEQLNTESLVVIEDAKFARALLGVLRRQTAGAQPFNPDSWSQPAESRAPLRGKARRLITPLLRLFSPLYRDQL